jgi:hypothetical protein
MANFTLVLNTEVDDAIILELASSMGDSRGKFAIMDENFFNNFALLDANVGQSLSGETPVEFTAEMVRNSFAAEGVDGSVINECISSLPEGFFETINKFGNDLAAANKEYYSGKDEEMVGVNTVVTEFYDSIKELTYNP